MTIPSGTNPNKNFDELGIAPKLLEILTLLRVVMAKDLPNVFEGIVEVDETYLGGQMKMQNLFCKKQNKPIQNC